MKKSLFSLFALTLGLLLAACSSKQKENTGPQSADLTVEAMEVYGDSPGILSVVPGTYKLNVDDKVSIKIKLKLEQTVKEWPAQRRMAAEKEKRFILLPVQRK